MNPGVALFLFLAIASIALFSFLAVAAWSGSRMSERQSYYKNETFKKIAESPEPAAALEYLRDHEMRKRKQDARKHRQGVLLGGLVVAAIGIALMVCLGVLVHRAAFCLIGLVPLLVGLALLLYVRLFAPAEVETR